MVISVEEFTLNYPINVVVDIGGTGTRIGLAKNHSATSVRSVNVNSYDDLAIEIRRLTQRAKPSAVAMSVPGVLIDGILKKSTVAPWLEGNVEVLLGSYLEFTNEKVTVVSDGQAHALALRSRPDVKYGAINFALGTSVAFGVIDAKGRLQRPLYGDNWEIGDFQLDTRCKDKSLWYVLGKLGFNELSQWRDADGFEHFGARLGNFVSQMSLLFRPRTVGLSGGIITHNWHRIGRGFRKEYDETMNKYVRILPKPAVIAQDDEHTALIGLATLFGRIATG